MSKDLPFCELRDGAQLHAAHIFQLADNAAALTAALAVGIGAAGRLVGPKPGQAAGGVKNRVYSDDGRGSVEVENIAVLTRGGYRAELPPPAKSFSRPRESGEKFLNLYVKSYGEGQGQTEARWEATAPSDPRGVALVEWVDEQYFVVLPLPFTIGVHSFALDTHQALALATDTFCKALLAAGNDGLERLRLLPEQRYLLDPLLGAARAVRVLDEGSSLSTALASWKVLALELLGWFQYIASNAEPGSARALVPDATGRLRLTRQSVEGLSDYVQLLCLEPTTTTLLLTWLEALRGAMVGLARLVQGEADEDPLQPVQRFEPEPWPDGLGFKYSLNAAGRAVSLRCEMMTDIEPQLLWGVGTAETMPRLMPATITSAKPGRYEAILSPGELREKDLIVIILDTQSAKFRAYLQRGSAAHSKS